VEIFNTPLKRILVNNSPLSEQPAHFKGKDAISHVAEAQAEGITASLEIHGTETPGRISAAADAARDTAVLIAILSTLLAHLKIGFSQTMLLFIIIGIGWIAWKAGRSAWLGWTRLERMHRVLAQEKWEIEHHRQQEREELTVLYAAKGFEGKLLEDVIDVLMADGDRLLKVMVEEELGLSLEAYDHPLKQSLGAFVGSVLALILCIGSYWIYPAWGALIGACTACGLGAFIAAAHARNALIPAVIWNLGLLALSFGIPYFLIDTFLPAIH
jgi:hypothetical protein